MAKKVLLRVASPKSGDPVKNTMEEEILYKPGQTTIERGLDVRDRLAELIGKGNAIDADTKSAIFADLQKMIGAEKAMKVMDHAFIFNSRPDVQKLPVEEKIKSFYTIGSRDTDVQDLINKSKGMGYGVIPGFRSSISQINQQLANRTSPAGVAQMSPEIQRKVLLKINK